MMTLYLRAESESILKAACPFLTHSASDAEAAIEPGDWKLTGPDFELVIIGSPMCIKDEVPGDPDPDTGEPTIAEPAQWDTGYHANLYTGPDFPHDVPEALVVHPNNPRRMRA